jgi:hypothetical protein
MARISPEAKRLRIIEVIDAWRRLARNVAFSRMSLAQFMAEVQPSLDARAEIDNLQRQLRSAISRRESADAHSFELISRVGHAVKGDQHYGPNSFLCEEMGYTRETVRRRNIRRGMRQKRTRHRGAAW